jgi:hypothetical protein
MKHGKVFSAIVVHTNKHGGTTRDVPQHVSVFTFKGTVNVRCSAVLTLSLRATCLRTVNLP